jgi:hypothetical protein
VSLILPKKLLSEAYPGMSEEELTKMALGRSKADYIRDELSLFTKEYPNVDIMEKSILIDDDDEDLGKISQYDLIVQRAQALEDRGII